MRETVIQFEEAMDWRGKPLSETEVAEVIELLHEARESVL